MRSAAPTFDRRVPERLLAVLQSDGPFAWVAELARTPMTSDGPPMDLGLRALQSKPGAGAATLYLGTTRVLDVVMRRDGRFMLKGHQPGKLFQGVDPPFDPAWTAWQDVERIDTARVRRHVEAAIAKAPKERQKEGRYQAALSRAPDGEYVLVDREISLSLVGGMKRAWIAAVRQPLLAAHAELGPLHDWAARVDPPGDKLDALAISHDGRLLVIEVKPGSAIKGLAWTPVQVAMYVRLLRSWVERDQPAAKTVLEGMARQRAALDLGQAPPSLRSPIEIVPVIAVGTPVNPRAAERFERVRGALTRAGEPLDGLEVWTVSSNGVVSARPGEELDRRFC